MTPEETIVEIRLLGFDAWWSANVKGELLRRLCQKAWRRDDRLTFLSQRFPLPEGYHWQDSWNGGSFDIVLYQRRNGTVYSFGRVRLKKQ